MKYFVPFLFLFVIAPWVVMFLLENGGYHNNEFAMWVIGAITALLYSEVIVKGEKMA